MARTTLFAVTAALTTLPVVAPRAEAAAQLQIPIQEWEVPWAQSRPRDPDLGPDGRVWFVGQRGDYVGVLDPATGDMNRFDLSEGAGPHNLLVTDDGTVWYTGNADRHIGRLDAASGAIERFPMPDEAARDPHTLIEDGHGGMWFTVQGGNFVGHFDPSDGDIELIQAPMAESRGRPASSRPYGIKLDSRGVPWVALFGTNLIARVDAASMTLETFELPDPGARPRRLVIDSADRIWYTDYARGKLGRLDPTTGDVSEWDNPGGDDSRPYGMAVDADDRIWFVETGLDPNTFVGFDPATEEFFSRTEIDSGGGAVRHMVYDRDDNVVWFGTDANTIGRAQLPPLRGRSVSEGD